MGHGIMDRVRVREAVVVQCRPLTRRLYGEIIRCKLETRGYLRERYLGKVESDMIFAVMG